MSTLSGLISAGGSASFPTIFLSKSQTFVPPQDGNVMIHVIGAGGSGNSNTADTISGGGAGGYCRKNSLAVTTSGSFTVVVGAGGAAVSGATAGNAGGNSTVAGTGLSSTLTANGGGGGVTSGTAAGGTASNGDVNNTGGSSTDGDGGGAVGITGTGNTGGEIAGSIGVYGGDCDIVGDFWSSTLGQLAGGIGGIGIHGQYAQNMIDSQRINGGPLAGGGQISQSISNLDNPVFGGNGGIGGGGGGARNLSSNTYCRSGRGGEGIVIFQYIP
tara:strand:- start:329 stop:1144 length:816 start_codon:yes stop_codon:yes gene_type:complete